MTPEGKVKALVAKWLHKQGFIKAGSATNKWPENPVGWYYCPVPSPYQVHGIPDFVGIYKGRWFSIEAKAAGGKPSENQLKRHEEIRQAGGLVWVVDCEEDLEQIEFELKEMENA